VFNPPHIGHLICAQEAQIQLGLDAVVWVPVGNPSHRTIEQDPGPEARLEMCELAVAGDERFAVSADEVEREGLSYTLDTLRGFRERNPAQELVLLMGGDQAAALPSWHEPEAILSLATIAVAERHGGRRDEVVRAVDDLAGAAERLTFFDMPRVDVSSSLVRRRAGSGQPVRYLVPEAVAQLISARRLYRAPVPVGGGA
jgi:nicotinate-nucleotide adenylyltransferase